LIERLLVAFGAVAGLLGVGLAAMAAHVTGGGNLDVAARFLLVHAPVLLAVPALAATKLIHPLAGRIAGLLVAAGLALFCGDLTVRAIWNVAPIRLAAPAGGIVLMAGWLVLIAAPMLGPRRS
jgi:uncharacterized membrane protein YgdD (TMEM256/DUF423 family)